MVPYVKSKNLTQLNYVHNHAYYLSQVFHAWLESKKLFQFLKYYDNHHSLKHSCFKTTFSNVYQREFETSTSIHKQENKKFYLKSSNWLMIILYFSFFSLLSSVTFFQKGCYTSFLVTSHAICSIQDKCHQQGKGNQTCPYQIII